MASNSSALVVFDGYFGNLRPLRHVSERICFFTSLAANAVLAVLLIREKNEVMKPYSRVLLINVAFDVLYTVICMLVETVGFCLIVRGLEGKVGTRHRTVTRFLGTASRGPVHVIKYPKTEAVLPYWTFTRVNVNVNF